MNTELAIQKAVEGGYDPNWNIGAIHEFPELYNRAWLDPEFFEALGKMEGWAETVMGHCGQDASLFEGKKSCCWYGTQRMEWFMTAGNYYQHRLIDAIQQGRSINEFFGEILKK